MKGQKVDARGRWGKSHGGGGGREKEGRERNGRRWGWVGIRGVRKRQRASRTRTSRASSTHDSSELKARGSEGDTEAEGDRKRRFPLLRGSLRTRASEEPGKATCGDEGGRDPASLQSSDHTQRPTSSAGSQARRAEAGPGAGVAWSTRWVLDAQLPDPVGFREGAARRWAGQGSGLGRGKGRGH